MLSRYEENLFRAARSGPTRGAGLGEGRPWGAQTPGARIHWKFLDNVVRIPHGCRYHGRSWHAAGSPGSAPEEAEGAAGSVDDSGQTEAVLRPSRQEPQRALLAPSLPNLCKARVVMGLCSGDVVPGVGGAGARPSGFCLSPF